MRLPIIGADPACIDEPQTIRMIRYAIDHGVNYVDTAYPYHGGQSEIVVGKALQDGYRAKTKIATKMPTWKVESRRDMDAALDEQLRKLRTDHIEFYLLHGLNKARWSKMKTLNVFDWAEKAIAENKIRYLGFSFHDQYDVFVEIVDGYDWPFCQIQYNYVDVEYQAGERGLKYAVDKGLAVVVMEPIGGGKLAVKPPHAVQAIWDEAQIKRSPVDWALQWVWNHPEVSVVLSGMSAMGHVVENVKSAAHSGPDTLTAKELELIERVRVKYLEYGFIGCTGCRYCLPCPNEVDIGEILALYNAYYTKRGDTDAQQQIKDRYLAVILPEKGAKRCTRCGECEEKCPQQLPIRRLIAKAAEIFQV